MNVGDAVTQRLALVLAQRAAQLAFDRALDGQTPAVTGDDVLAAVAMTRPSVGAASAERFAAEAERYSRL